MKRDPLIIGVTSVLVIAFTLSLLNIYVFPDIFFNIKVDRYAASDSQEELLMSIENISFDSDIFEGINFSEILTDSPENALINLTTMINLSLEKRSAAYDNEATLMPRRIKLRYNGTIVGFNNNSQYYEEWIDSNQDTNQPYSYLAFVNPALNVEVFSNFTLDDLDTFTLDDILEALDDIMSTPSIPADFVIYQTIEYTESRGMFNEYSTQFKRFIIIDAFGEILFFLTNEGYWTQPLLY
jgi:hypothetical protein